MFLRIIVYLTLALNSLYASAFNLPCRPARLQRNISDLLQPIGVIGIPDRRTEREFAGENGQTLEAVQATYAANGRLICEKSILNANLVLVNNLIVTSAHAFFKRQNCDKVSAPQSCIFEIRIGNILKKTKIKSLESIGFNCGRESNGRQSTDDDWAVLRLEDEVQGVTPFSISSGKELKDKQPVTAVSSVNLDFFPNGQQASQYVKSIGNCQIGKTYRQNGDVAFFSSDCDGAEGSSASAILSQSRGAAPTLLGIYSGSNETAEQLGKAIRRKSPNAAEFVDGEWASYGVPLQGTFLKSVLAAAQK